MPRASRPSGRSRLEGQGLVGRLQGFGQAHQGGEGLGLGGPGQGVAGLQLDLGLRLVQGLEVVAGLQIGPGGVGGGQGWGNQKENEGRGRFHDTYSVPSIG